MGEPAHEAVHIPHVKRSLFHQTGVCRIAVFVRKKCSVSWSTCISTRSIVDSRRDSELRSSRIKGPKTFHLRPCADIEVLLPDVVEVVGF